nr:MAG TPA: hypothetical protein [Caudoviricetes sp.]
MEEWVLYGKIQFRNKNKNIWFDFVRQLRKNLLSRKSDASR